MQPILLTVSPSLPVDDKKYQHPEGRRGDIFHLSRDGVRFSFHKFDKVVSLQIRA